MRLFLRPYLPRRRALTTSRTSDVLDNALSSEAHSRAMTRHTSFASLKAPKASTLRRVDNILRVGSVVVGVAMVVCAIAAPPAAPPLFAAFVALCAGGVAVSSAARRQERRETQGRGMSDVAA